jgi:hypothetical protein
MASHVYANRLRIMRENCNKHYITTCISDSLFALHYIQWIQAHQPGATRPFLMLVLQPFSRHPTRLVFAHRVHGNEMHVGLPNDFESLDDFDDSLCNIDIEPMVWNYMRGNWDQQYLAIVDRLKQVPIDNEPYWNREQVQGPAPDVPRTVWRKHAREAELAELLKLQLGPTIIAPAPAPGTEGHPNRGNLVNTDNLCYSSAIIQAIANVPMLNSLIDLVRTFPFSPKTGRGPPVPADTQLDKHREALELLQDVCAFIHATDGRVDKEVTSNLMKALRKIDSQFVPGQMLDASDLLTRILSMLVIAGDRSEPRLDGQPHPIQELIHDQDRRIVAGERLMTITGELTRHVKAYRDSGNSSVADLNLTTTTVSESHCRYPSCESPFARNFNFSLYHTLEFPRNDDNVHSVTDLLRLTTQSAGEANCGHDPDHGHKKPSITKVVGTPDVLILSIKRISITASQYTFQAGDSLEQIADVVRKELVVEPTLDLREFCDTELPSERTLGQHDTTELKTLYKLTSVVKFQSNHYITFAFAPDEAGNMHWARFDDTKPRVEWASPFTRSGVSSTEPVEVLLFYTQMTDEEVTEHAVKAAEAARAADAARIARVARAAHDESESESEEDDDDDDEFEVVNLLDDTESIASSSSVSSENGDETFHDHEDVDPMQQAHLTADVFLAIAEQFSRVGQTDQS